MPPPTTRTSRRFAVFLARCVVLRCSAMSNDFLDDFGDILNLDRLAVGEAQAAVGEIGDAVGTGGPQHPGAVRPGLLQSEVGKSFALRRFHPDSATAAAATKAA